MEVSRLSLVSVCPSLHLARWRLFLPGPPVVPGCWREEVREGVLIHLPLSGLSALTVDMGGGSGAALRLLLALTLNNLQTTAR